MAAYTEGVFSGTPRQFLDKIIAFCTHANVGYTLTEAVTGFGTGGTAGYHCTLSKTVTVYGKTNTIHIGLSSSGDSAIYDHIYGSGTAMTGILVNSYTTWQAGYVPYTQPTRVVNWNNMTGTCGFTVPAANMPYFMASDGNFVFIGTTNLDKTVASPSTPYCVYTYWCAAINPAIAGSYTGGQFYCGMCPYDAYAWRSSQLNGYFGGCVGTQYPSNAISNYRVTPNGFSGALQLTDADYGANLWCGLVSPQTYSVAVNAADGDTYRAARNIKCPGGTLGRCVTASIDSVEHYDTRGRPSGSLPISTRTYESRRDTNPFYYNLSQWTGAFMPNDIHLYVNRISNEKMVAAGTIPGVKYAGLYLEAYTQDITLSDGIAYKVCGANLVEKTGTQITI